MSYHNHNHHFIPPYAAPDMGEAFEGEDDDEGYWDRVAEAVEKDAPKKKEKEKRTSAASQLVESTRKEKLVTLFHTPDQEAFITVPVGDHRETFSIKSKSCRRWLSRRFLEKHGKTIGAQGMQDALTTLESLALFDGPEFPVHTRLAEHYGAIYLDLCNPAWQAVRITAEGWEILEEAPVKFRRARGMLPLPTPVRGGAIEDLLPFLNVTDEQWPLVVAWLVAALRPSGPYPVLCLHGEQGSAKSTTERMLRALVDPNSAPIRAAPRDARDLMIAATNSWIVALDNLSYIPDWLSDALCRLATGGGFTTRTLYTDDEEMIFDATRPVILNGITELATRGDLLERCLIVTLASIPDEKRKPEKVLWRKFAEAKPRVLGALLDIVAGALRELPNVHLELPRMADFAEWAAAAEKALGWKLGSFMAAYTSNTENANELALEASTLVEPLRSFVNQRGGDWEGTARELWEALELIVGSETAKKDHGFPKKPHVLSGYLRRLAPNLRRAGLDVQFRREPGSNRRRLIRLKVLAKERPDRPEPSQEAGSCKEAEASRDAERNDVREAGTASYVAETGEGTVGPLRDGVLQPSSNGNLAAWLYRLSPRQRIVFEDWVASHVQLNASKTREQAEAAAFIVFSKRWPSSLQAPAR